MGTWKMRSKCCSHHFNQQRIHSYNMVPLLLGKKSNVLAPRHVEYRSPRDIYYKHDALQVQYVLPTLKHLNILVLDGIDILDLPS